MVSFNVILDIFTCLLAIVYRLLALLNYWHCLPAISFPTMHPLSYSLISLLFSLLSLASAITILCTSDSNSTTFPATIAWLTLSAALVYISFCVLLFTWLRLRKKWNGSQESFEKLPTGSEGKAWVFKCDSRSSNEISAGRERSQGTFYWCGESLRRVVHGKFFSWSC